MAELTDIFGEDFEAILEKLDDLDDEEKGEEGVRLSSISIRK